MEFTGNKLKIEVDIGDFIDAHEDSFDQSFWNRMACVDSIIRNVALQIIDGMTEDLSHGARHIEAYENPTCALDRAVRDVSKASSEIARNEIERLERTISNLKNRNKILEEKCHQVVRMDM